MPSKLTIVSVLVLGGVGFGVYKFQLVPGLGPKPAAAQAPAQVQGPPAAYLEVNTLTVRLADKDSEHYLRIAPVLQINAADEDHLKERLAIVRDTIFTVVAAKQSSDLMTPAGSLKLKQDLLEMLNKTCPEKIGGVYFEDYLVE